MEQEQDFTVNLLLSVFLDQLNQTYLENGRAYFSLFLTLNKNADELATAHFHQWLGEAL